MPTPAPSPWQDLRRPPLRRGSLRAALTSTDAATWGSAGRWRRLEVVAETGSTNVDVAGWARAGEPAGAVLVADHQRAGRGRRERVWQSPARAGLAVSVLLRPGDPGAGEQVVAPQHWSWLGLLAGVAVTDALMRTCGLNAVLKWPNDVLVPTTAGPGGGMAGMGLIGGTGPPGRVGDELGKVAGVLAEVVRGDSALPSSGAVVLGFGLNVSQEVSELPVPTATSLRLAGSATIDRDVVLRAVLRALAVRYHEWAAAAGDPRAGLAAVYRERCTTIGRRILVHLPDERTLEGVAEGVDDAGRLLVRAGDPTGPAGPEGMTTALSAGDVVHIRPAELA